MADKPTIDCTRDFSPRYTNYEKYTCDNNKVEVIYNSNPTENMRYEEYYFANYGIYIMKTYSNGDLKIYMYVFNESDIPNEVTYPFNLITNNTSYNIKNVLIINGSSDFYFSKGVKDSDEYYNQILGWLNNHLMECDKSSEKELQMAKDFCINQGNVLDIENFQSSFNADTCEYENLNKWKCINCISKDVLIQAKKEVCTEIGKEFDNNNLYIEEDANGCVTDFRLNCIIPCIKPSEAKQAALEICRDKGMDMVNFVSEVDENGCIKQEPLGVKYNCIGNINEEISDSEDLNNGDIVKAINESSNSNHEDLEKILNKDNKTDMTNTNKLLEDIKNKDNKTDMTDTNKLLEDIKNKDNKTDMTDTNEKLNDINDNVKKLSDRDSWLNNFIPADILENYNEVKEKMGGVSDHLKIVEEAITGQPIFSEEVSSLSSIIESVNNNANNCSFQPVEVNGVSLNLMNGVLDNLTIIKPIVVFLIYMGFLIFSLRLIFIFFTRG